MCVCAHRHFRSVSCSGIQQFSPGCWSAVCLTIHHWGTSVQVPCFLSPVEPYERSCRVLCERASSFPWGNTQEFTRWLAHVSARLTVLRNRLASQVAAPCHRPASNRGDLGPSCPHSTWCCDRQDECPRASQNLSARRVSGSRFQGGGRSWSQGRMIPDEPGWPG